MTDIGIGFDQATVSYTINTSTGSGAVLIPIVVSGGIVAVIVQNPGEDYAATDTVEFNNAAAASATGTYTFVANPTATQTIILNGITWQFVASGATGNQTNIRGQYAGDAAAARRGSQFVRKRFDQRRHLYRRRPGADDHL